MAQNAKHANLRPYLSAKEPTNDALTAAEMKPVMKRAATTASSSFFSSLYRVYM